MGRQVWLMAGNTRLITDGTPFPENEDLEDKDVEDIRTGRTQQLPWAAGIATGGNSSATGRNGSATGP